jgi:S1-C subfamily serine protease
MRNIIHHLILIIIVFNAKFVISQTQLKYYYDENWNGCSQNNAAFYRIINLDKDGKYNGKIKDYFISGELQSEIDKAIYIDKNSDKNSIFTGKSIGYYKSGKKNFEHLMDDKGKEIYNFHWYENGNKKSESRYKNGELDGLVTKYYENGKIESMFNFTEGIIDKWWIECDEFESCQKLFSDNFYSEIDFNNWEPANNSKYKSKIIAEKGFQMENLTEDGGYAQWIHLPINIENNFSIETIIDFKEGSKNNGHGLIWGFKDWDNYNYFYISANGYFKTGAKSDGISLEYIKWTQSEYINQNYARNLIKINKVEDKIYFSINGQIVGSETFYRFKGNNIGFSINSGYKKVLFEKLTVKQDIELNQNVNEEQSINANNDEWKGNGTGFFIDPKGYIATNFHVIEAVNDIQVDFIYQGQKKSYKAKVISTDKQNDLAVLKIDDTNFKPFINLPYNFKTQISDVGSNVFALGYPMALTAMGDEIKFTDGKISSKTGYEGNITTYQISVPIQPGNSGGPLFDYDGNVIGITNAGITSADNVAYAIKSSYLKNLIEVLPESLKIPNDFSISSKTLTEKIKILSDYVVLIKVK